MQRKNSNVSNVCMRLCKFVPNHLLTELMHERRICVSFQILTASFHLGSLADHEFASKGPGKRGHIVADTLLPTMFLGLRKLGNICCGHKMFLNKIRNNFCVRNKCCARGQTGKHLCRQQSVRGNVSSFARVLTRPKQLSMAATAGVIWLCVCVWYWPDRGLVFKCVTCFYCCLKPYPSFTQVPPGRHPHNPYFMHLIWRLPSNRLPLFAGFRNFKNLSDHNLDDLASKGTLVLGTSLYSRRHGDRP